MSEAIQADLAVIADLVKGADLAEGQKRTATWCIDQLPGLYDNFRRTYESRYGDEIFRLEQGMLKEVAGAAGGAATRAIAESIAGRLKELHERLGLPLLDPKPPAPPKRSRKSA